MTESVGLEDEEDKDLADLIQTYKLPFYSRVKNENSSSLVYLYEAFDADCLFAKCYSNSGPVINYLLHHRPSFTTSESNLTSTINQTQTSNVEFMFTDIVNIPYHYHGLFELLSSNSTKAGGILDHERDLISLADHVTTPKNYYVAKEMKVYEIVEAKNVSCMFLTKLKIDSTFGKKKCLHRKWTSFKQGTICKAMRVVMVDYDAKLDDSDNSYWSHFKNFLCCNSYGIKKTDIAIEFKIIENFDELVNNTDTNEVQFKPGNNETGGKKLNLSKKSYFLPVNESKFDNDIDLIPISQMAKKLSLNNLQTINNLIFNNMLINNSLELKLFDENPFLNATIKSQTSSKKSSSKSDNLINIDLLKLERKKLEFLKLNQHLELDKYLSIFELTKFKLKTKIVIGFCLETEQLFFLPMEQINSDFKLAENKFTKISQSDENENSVINNFKLNSLGSFETIAKIEIRNFNFNLNKIETFCMLNRENALNKNKTMQKKQSIVNHFSDLVNVDAESINKRYLPLVSPRPSVNDLKLTQNKISIEILDVKSLIKLSNKFDFNSLPNRKGILPNRQANNAEFKLEENEKVKVLHMNHQRIFDLKTNTLPSKKMFKTTEVN